MRFRLYSPGFNFPNFKIFRPGGSQLSAGHFPLLPGRCCFQHGSDALGRNPLFAGHPCVAALLPCGPPARRSST